MRESRKSFLNSWGITSTSCVNVASWKALEIWSSWHRFMHVDIMYNSMHSTRATPCRTIDHPRVPFKNIAPTKRCAIISGTMSLECIFSRSATIIALFQPDYSRTRTFVAPSKTRATNNRARLKILCRYDYTT